MKGVGGSYLAQADGDPELIFRTNDPRAEIPENIDLMKKKAVKHGKAGTKQGDPRQD